MNTYEVMPMIGEEWTGSIIKIAANSRRDAAREYQMHYSGGFIVQRLRGQKAAPPRISSTVPAGSGDEEKDMNVICVPRN